MEILLKLSKNQAFHLIEIIEYMEHGVFDSLWHDNADTAQKITKMIKTQVKEAN